MRAGVEQRAVHAAACKLYEPEKNGATPPNGRWEYEELLRTIWEFSQPSKPWWRFW